MNRRQRGGERNTNPPKASNRTRNQRAQQNSKQRNPDKDRERPRNKNKFRRKKTYRQVSHKSKVKEVYEKSDLRVSGFQNADSAYLSNQNGSESKGSQNYIDKNLGSNLSDRRLANWRNLDSVGGMYHTPEKTGSLQKTQRPNFLLIKNLESGVSEKQIRKALSVCYDVQNYPIFRNCGNVYIKFPEINSILKVIERNKQKPIFPLYANVKICLVNKLPLDLNRKSKIGIHSFFKTYFFYLYHNQRISN